MWNFVGRRERPAGVPAASRKATGFRVSSSSTKCVSVHAGDKAADHTTGRNTCACRSSSASIGLIYHFSRDNKDAGSCSCCSSRPTSRSVFTSTVLRSSRTRALRLCRLLLAYAMWIGIGVLAIYDFCENAFRVRWRPSPPPCSAAVPVVAGQARWNDHDRSEPLYLARLAAVGYLEILRTQRDPVHQRRQRHLPALVRPEVEWPRMCRSST